MAQQSLAAGETVVDIPATLAPRVRLLGTGRSEKNDPNDARSVVIAALRAPVLVPVRVEDHATVLRLLALFVIRRSVWAKTSRCVASTCWCELVPGGIPKQIVARQAFQVLEELEPVGAVGRERHLLVFELLDDVARFDEQRNASERRIKSAVCRLGWARTLTEVFGIGDAVVAATLIGHTGDVSRFATEDKFAVYNGTAPIREWSSGNPKRPTYRPSRTWNRTINDALDIAVVTQLRHADSPGRVFYDRPQRICRRRGTHLEAQRSVR